MPISSVIDLVGEIVRLQVLTSAQRTELEVSLAPMLSEPKALAAEMLKRNWLTPFQVNLLFAGRTDELILHPYVLQQRIGEGGMGQVFKAMHTVLRRIDAVKLVRLDAQHPETRTLFDRFEKEAIASARVVHRNLVGVYTAEKRGNTFFLGMELLDGSDIGRLVARHPDGLPVTQACEIVRQAALGLQAAHTNGLIHRDVKPSNLMLTGDGTVKVLDLGLACIRSTDQDDSRLTKPGSMMGTPDYMPPEQFTDSATVDERADIYALGCTLYHLLTGRPPFPGGSLFEKMRHHCDHEATPLRERRPEVAAELAVLVHAMMAKTPEKRPQSAAAVAVNLAPFSGGASAIPVAHLVPGPRDSGPVPVPPNAIQAEMPTQRGITEQNLPLQPTAPDIAVPRNPSQQRLTIAAGGGVLAILLVFVLLKVLSGGKSNPDNSPPPPPPQDNKPTLVVDTNGGGLTSIREAVEKAKDGMRIRVKPGTYREAIVLHKSVELVGDGKPEEVVVESLKSDTLSVTANDVVVRGFTFICSTGESNQRHALDLIGRCVIEKCRIRSNSLAGVVVRGQATLRDCVIYEAAAGVLLIGNGEVLLEDCDIFRTKLSALEAQGKAKATALRCKLRDSLDAHGAIATDDTEMTLDGCTISGNVRSGIVCAGKCKVRVKNCTIRQGKSAGMLLETSNVEIDNCDLDANDMSQVRIIAGATPTLRQCRIHGGLLAGVSWGAKAGGRMEGCQIWGHRKHEIHIEDEADPLIVNCTITKCAGTGIFIGKGGKGRFEGCNIHSHKQSAVYVTGESEVSLKLTEIHDGETDGVKAWNKGKATLDRCKVFGNGNTGVVAGPDGTVFVRGGSVEKNNAFGIVAEATASIDVEGCQLQLNVLGNFKKVDGAKVRWVNNREQ